MSTTFGSVGDIIATIQIASRLLTVLSASRRSVNEFQSLVIELRTFHCVLEQLLLFWQSRKECLLLNNLGESVQPLIHDTQGVISKFLDNIISKYGTSLKHTPPSRLSLKEIGKMLQWQMFETGAVARLRDKIRQSKDVIILVQLSAQEFEEEQDRKLVDEKLSAIMDLEDQISTQIDDRFDQLENKMETQNELLGRLHRSVGSIVAAIAPVLTATLDIRITATRIYSELVAQGNSFRALNPYAGNEITIEDALGWTFRIPLEIVRSWPTFHSILIDKFATRSGCELVKKNRWLLRDSSCGRDLQQNMPLHSAVRPGQKINMVMVFFSNEGPGETCLRCHGPVILINSVETECENPECGMAVQRIRYSSNIDDLDSWQQGKHPLLICDNDGETGTNHIEKTVPASLLTVRGKEESPEVFKRIRFITRWEDRPESRGKLRGTIDGYFCWSAASIEAKSLKMGLKKVFETSCSNFWDDPLGLDYEGNWTVGLNVYFIGTDMRHSRPIIVLYSEDKKISNRALKFLEGLDVVKSTDRFAIATVYGGLFQTRYEKSKHDCDASKRTLNSYL